MTSPNASSSSTVDPRVAAALATGGIIDISTTGRRSGQPHRIEIAFFNVGGRIFISGMPGPRDWYANLLRDPGLVLHLKDTAQADLPARARPVVEAGERRAVLEQVLAGIGRQGELDRWMRESPLVEVELT